MLACSKSGPTTTWGAWQNHKVKSLLLGSGIPGPLLHEPLITKWLLFL